VSLGRVLDELAEDLDRLGCPGYSTLADDPDDDAQQSYCLTADQVRADRLRLDEGVSEVKDIVDRRVAHMDKAKVTEPLKVSPVHESIDTLISFFQRYETFLTGGTPPDFTPLIRRDMPPGCPRDPARHMGAHLQRFLPA
jgi:hypothetical protein